MLIKRIIPCLDIKDSRVVKGISFGNLRDAGDPVACAALYEQQGADELVVLDITATLEGRRATLKLVENIRRILSIPLTVGGGVRSLDDVRALLNSGADKVSLNSAALANPEIITQMANNFGRQCTVIAIDAKSDGDAWRIFTRAATDRTEWNAVNWAHYAVELGAGEILLTSIDHDGQQSGYDLELTRAIASSVPVPVIASGGAGKVSDFLDALNAGAGAVLAASLFHDGVLNITDLKNYLHTNGQEMRL